MTIFNILTHNDDSNFFLPFFSAFVLSKNEEMFNDMIKKLLICHKSYGTLYGPYPPFNVYYYPSVPRGVFKARQREQNVNEKDYHFSNSKELIGTLHDYYLRVYLGLSGGKYGGARKTRNYKRAYEYNTLLLSPTNYKLIKPQRGYVITKDTKESITRFIEREFNEI